MITGELKNEIDSIWEIFWTGGLTKPLDVIEQMTYLMFIHDLDDSDNLRKRKIFHCGASSKDAGNKITTISKSDNRTLYYPMVDNLLQQPVLRLR